MNADYAPPRSWEQFEELCADVFQSEFGDPALVRYGRAGQAQHGVDILARHGALYPIGLQCKKRGQWPVKKLTKPDIDAEIKRALKFEPALKAYWILTTAPADAPLLTHVAEINQRHESEGRFKVALLGWDEIVRRATRNRGVADKHFGPAGSGAPRSPLLATWMMSGGVLEMKGKEFELSVAELAQDLREFPEGHFIVRQRESDELLVKLKAFPTSGLSDTQRQRRIELREELRKLTEAEARAVRGIRLMLADPEISPYLLLVWKADVHRSVAAFVNGHVAPGITRGPQNRLRLIPPKASPDRRCSTVVTPAQAAAIMQAAQNFQMKYKNRMVEVVDELPDAVRATVAVPRIVQGIIEFESEGRLSWDQIRAMGALKLGSWKYEVS